MSERAVFIRETSAERCACDFMRSIRSQGTYRIEKHIRRGEMRGYQVHVNAPLDGVQGYLTEDMVEGITLAA